jgi:predicted ATPase
MDGSRFIHQLKIQNFLSYGSTEQIIDLQPLNIIIGTNASGKSNLLEVIGFLQASPKDLMKPIRDGGGAREWFWKGSKDISPVAKIEALINYPDGTMPLRHRIEFALVADRLEIIDEVIENEKITYPKQKDVYFFYRYQRGKPQINVRTTIGSRSPSKKASENRNMMRESLKPDQSVLSQRKDPDLYPELTYIGNQFTEIKLYREWTLGRYNAPRMPQKTDLPEDFLLEDASNLGLVLNNLQHHIGMNKIIEKMKEFYALVEDITTKISNNTVQIFLHEKGLKQPVPATRLSDGTLRYLSLLTILLHPSPPPLICLEEPELGLHPDILPTLANLLIEASQRTQLIVTTHSDVLISAFSEVPDAVLVCERDETGSHLSRVEPNNVRSLLENSTLGELWRMGELGGNRW